MDKTKEGTKESEDIKSRECESSIGSQMAKEVASSRVLKDCLGLKVSHVDDNEGEIHDDKKTNVQNDEEEKAAKDLLGTFGEDVSKPSFKSVAEATKPNSEELVNFSSSGKTLKSKVYNRRQSSILKALRNYLKFKRLCRVNRLCPE